MVPITDIDTVTEVIVANREVLSSQRSLLVGISGIDGSGKGYVAKQIVARLWQHSITTASISVDGWLNLTDIRFDSMVPAEHFYTNAIRFDEFFSELVLPLRDRGSIYLVTDFVEETATKYRKHTYDFKNVDVILVEGIFLFKPQYRDLFDLAIWIECSFSTALARAIDRAQEGLSPAKTIAAYDTTYFPAQRIHLAHDQPRENVDLIFNNDSYPMWHSSAASRQLGESPQIALS